MPTIQWDQSMATGLETVDAQHKQLIAWLNDLIEAIGQGRARSEIQGLLAKLGAYTAFHFGHEEECMARYKCPAAEQNILAHKDFVVTLAALRDEFDRNGATAHLVVRVEVEMLRWLTTHIKRTDTQLLPCVEAAQS
jgi:hemerythrin-like metal-binding protein